MVQKGSLALILGFALVTGCDTETQDVMVDSDLTVLTGARLIDGTGGPPVEDATLVIRGERLEGVGATADMAIPEGAELVDVTGMTIMPPMISLHIHLAQTDDGFDNHARHFNEENIREKLNQYARYGVLHTVSQGSDKSLIYEIRDRQRARDFPGALVYTAGRGFGVEGGYPPLQEGAEGELDVYRPGAPEEASLAVQELAEHDPDFVKVWVEHAYQTVPQVTPEIYQTIVQQAHDEGLTPVAHIYTLANAHGLVDAGVDGIIHSVRDEPVDEAFIEKMRERDVFYVPTLVREEVMFIYAGRAPYLDDPFFTAHHPSSVVERLESDEFQDEHRANPNLDRWRGALSMAQENLRTLHEAGVRLGFGSDSGPPTRWEGYFEHREMELMAEAGLTPAEIIQIASLNSAEILGIDADYGSIVPGKMAEFLILEANPLDDISNTKTLDQVWQRGARIH